MVRRLSPPSAVLQWLWLAASVRALAEEVGAAVRVEKAARVCGAALARRPVTPDARGCDWWWRDSTAGRLIARR